MEEWPAEMVVALAQRLCVRDVLSLCYTCTWFHAVLYGRVYVDVEARYRATPSDTNSWKHLLVVCAPNCAMMEQLLEAHPDPTGQPHDLPGLLRAAAATSLPLTGWVLRRWASAFHLADLRAAFRRACKHGSVATAQWLAREFPEVARLTATERVLLNVHGFYGSEEPQDVAFRCACRGGNLACAQWLAAEFCCHSAKAAALRSACKAARLANWDPRSGSRDHVTLVHWLATDVFFRQPASRAAVLAAFGAACVGGHQALVEWLAAEFHLTAHDASTAQALCRACVYGHATLAQWCVRHFGFEKRREVRFQLGIRDKRTVHVRGAFTTHRSKLCWPQDGHAGRAAVAQWLEARFGIRTEWEPSPWVFGHKWQKKHVRHAMAASNFTTGTSL